MRISYISLIFVKQQYGQLLVQPKPFVKWAGGKRQLIPILASHTPYKFGTYHEPFLGGGAMLFHLLSINPNSKCDVSDLNSDLVLAYITIRDKVDDLIESLKEHERHYKKDSKSYYNLVRSSNPKNAIAKTSRLIFLNRTCFNGLYRVNKKGQFNVPMGRYSNPNIVNEENLYAVSTVLQSSRVSIRCKDFGAVVDSAKRDDFVYFDPPYQPVSSTANFTSYTNRDFTFEDLERLGEICSKLDSKGCKVMVSNSDSNEVKKIFSDKTWKVHRIAANRAINSDSRKRTGHYELLVKNF